ncbi:MAG: hypothetical protein OEW19_15855 [Acidobacteriota bacterium]|nr:hypothetical protein [Acidobacteriota bacterium]
MRSLSRWFMAALAGAALAWVSWTILHPFLPALGVAATGLVFGGMLYAFHKLAQWAESRGWIHYQNRQGSWDAVGGAMAEVHSIYRPGQRYVKQLKEDAHVHEEHDDAGDGRGMGRTGGR